MTINDTARPRYLALDADYKLEVAYHRADASTGTPARIAPLDVTDDTGESVSEDDLFTLARDLCEYDGDCVEDALDHLLGYAIELDRAEHNVVIACTSDDEPVPYVPIDAPEDTSDWWESCFGADPEARAVYLDDADVNAFAREGTTRCVIEALDRAAGGAR